MRNSPKSEGYNNEENGIKKYYKEEAWCSNGHEKFKEEEWHDEEECKVESKDEESHANQCKENAWCLDFDIKREKEGNWYSYLEEDLDEEEKYDNVAHTC